MPPAAPIQASPRPALTPFVPGLRDGVTAALRDLLGLPAAVALTWHAEAGHAPGLYLAVQIGPEDACLELVLHAPGLEPQALFQGTHLWLTHRIANPRAGLQAVAADPGLLRALQRRLHWVDARGPEQAPLGPLVAALAQVQAFAGVHDDELRTVGADEAVVRLGFRCNQDCSFCWQGRSWPRPPDAVYARWFQEIAAQGVTRLVLSGGEPTLHPNLPQLVADARGLGFDVALQTNAIRLARPDLLAALVAAGLGSVRISYHSADAAVSDAMTRAPGTHVRTEAGIRACLRAGLDVDLNCVVERRNLAGLDAHARKIVDDFLPLAEVATRLHASYSWPNRYFDSAAYDDHLLPLDAVSGPLARAAGVLADAGLVVHATGQCGFPLCTLRDRPDLVIPMQLQRMPERHQTSRHAVGACAACAVRDGCTGARNEYVRRFGERGLVAFATVPDALRVAESPGA